MATNLMIEEYEKLQNLFECPKEREKAISSLLEDPEGTLTALSELCSEVCEKNLPIFFEVCFLSESFAFIKREPKLLQLVDENIIEAFDETQEILRKKIWPLLNV